MRIIIIESTVYKATEKQYNELKDFEKNKYENGRYQNIELEISEWLDGFKTNLKRMGDVDYDFRL